MSSPEDKDGAIVDGGFDKMDTVLAADCYNQSFIVTAEKDMMCGNNKAESL